MKPAERVLSMLRGDPVDRIPFTAYENKVSPGAVERELRNNGMCIVYRTVAPFVQENSSARRSTISTICHGETEVRTVIETDKGILESVDLDRGAGHNVWHREHLFKSEADYPVLETYFQDIIYRENFDAVRRAADPGAGDLFFRGYLGYSPMHHIMYHVMGIEKFSFEWADNRGHILRLYEVLRQKRLELAALLADAPNPVFNIGGNVSANVVSPAMYAEYYLPEYNSVAEKLHRGGKLCGIHFDGITAPFADLISRTDIDYVEALTPPPTGDVTVADAHRFWPEKAIWINFPSSVHVEDERVIRGTAKTLLEEARPEKRFLMGITEDVPPDRWPVSFPIILEEVNAYRLD